MGWSLVMRYACDVMAVCVPSFCPPDSASTRQKHGAMVSSAEQTHTSAPRHSRAVTSQGALLLLPSTSRRGSSKTSRSPGSTSELATSRRTGG